MLQPDTKLKLIAIHKQTFKEFEKIITYHEWRSLEKNKNYYYKCYEV